MKGGSRFLESGLPTSKPADRTHDCKNMQVSGSSSDPSLGHEVETQGSQYPGGWPQGK